MKRKSAWLSFTACALTAASVPHGVRAADRIETPVKAPICRVCPLHTGALGRTVWSESAKGATAYQPGATPQVCDSQPQQG